MWIPTQSRRLSSPASVLAAVDLPSPTPLPHPRSIGGVEDADELETVDDGSGQAVAGAGEDVSERKALWSQLRSMIGADVMSLLSVPVFIMEPTTTLQKMSEILQYAELVDKACDEKDEDLRLAYICALAISTYSSNERVKKPFNPILGETWEMTLPGGGVYVSEQVCHHPPIGAGHAETDRWTYDLTSAVKTKFMGNWVDVWPQGRTRIKLKSSGDVYNICPPPSRVNNVLVGRTWIDTFGDMQVNNLTTGASASIKFTECNMFGTGRWGVNGEILDKDGNVKYRLSGKWNESVSVTPPGAADDAARTLWTKEPAPADPTKYGFTNFTFKQNAADTCPKGLLASDSRLRPDRAALEAGDANAAGAMKHALEEAQRAERRIREEKNEAWNPRWFKLAKDADLHELERDVGTAVWEWNGEYAAVSAERAAAAEATNPLESNAFDPWCYEETKRAAAEGYPTSGA